MSIVHQKYEVVKYAVYVVILRSIQSIEYIGSMKCIGNNSILMEDLSDIINYHSRIKI